MATLEAATQHIIDLAEQHGAFDEGNIRTNSSAELGTAMSILQNMP